MIEMVVTVTIIGILAMIAMPSYLQFVESGRLTTATNDFVADVSYARIQALKLGPNPQTGMCVSTTGTSCAAAPATWQSGWIVFIDADANGTYNTSGGDTILKTHDALPSSITAATTPTGTNTLIFTHAGSMSIPITSLQLNDTKVNQNRVVCLNGGTGRAMVANNNNVTSCQ